MSASGPSGPLVFNLLLQDWRQRWILFKFHVFVALIGQSLIAAGIVSGRNHMWHVHRFSQFRYSRGCL